MRYLLLIIITLFIPAAMRPTAAYGAPSPRAPCVVRAEFSAIVSSGTADYLLAALNDAEQRRCSALVVTLDTPGGALEATRAIVQAFLNARVPVVVHVSPSGARAGSAGVFITMAAHIAAMAPGTTIGAAHPVIGMGKDPEEAGGEQLARKIVSDVAAMARAIAQRRERNVEWAEAAVRESVSATAEEAEDTNIIDLVAASEDELLAEIHGMTIQTEAGPVELHTRGAEVLPFEMSVRQRVWSVVSNPNIVYLLLMIGIFGILFELYSPGLIIPGAVGALALLLAAIGLDILPVNTGAVVLLVLGAIMLAAEIYIVSYGLLTLGGLAALILGASLLIDRSTGDFFADASVRLSWGAVLPPAILLAAVAAGLAWRSAELQRRAPATGKEAMLDHVGEAMTDIGAQAGQVRIGGERWRALSHIPIAAGEPVRVVGIEGLTLRVVPASVEDGSGQEGMNTQ